MKRLFPLLLTLLLVPPARLWAGEWDPPRSGLAGPHRH